MSDEFQPEFFELEGPARIEILALSRLARTA
jgi:hypothetical protein